MARFVVEVPIMQMPQHLRIREATVADAAALASLAGELGYPTNMMEMEDRLKIVASHPDDRVLVGERVGVVGWIQVSVVHSLEGGSYAEIRGLVVTGSARGSGVGTRLVAEAEQWARVKKLREIRVRTNVVRAETQEFYRKRGYTVKKRQEVFEKVL